MNLLVWYRSLMRSVGAALVKLIVTATSGLVSFTTNVIRPVKVTCEFSPIQDLSHGNPSPENECPISGWTGCEITRSGKNLFSTGLLIYGYFISEAGVITAGSDVAYTELIPVQGNQDYILSFYQKILNVIIRVHGYDKSGNWIQQFGVIKTNTEARKLYTIPFTTTNNTEFVRLSFYIKNTTNIQLEAGTVRSVYEEYRGTTTPIAFTNPSTGDPLTVYGGTVTLNEDGSADLIAGYAAVQIKNITWTRDTTGTYRMFYGKNTSIRNAKIYCDTFRYIGNRSYGNLRSYGEYDLGIGRLSNNGRIFIREDSQSSVSAFTTAYGEYWIVYPLVTALSYHFDNVGQLITFIGTNNIWHNMNGSITAEYYKKQ